MPKGNLTAVPAWGISHASATRLIGIAGEDYTTGEGKAIVGGDFLGLQPSAECGR